MIDIDADNWLGTLLPQIISLAREAGQAILKIYSEMNQTVEYKPDNSPLTRADLVSHHVILDGLARLSPDWPVLSEESTEIPFNQRRSWHYFWLVDPLDGTKEFLRRSGEFTVNIALIKDNAPILGVVFAPMLDKMYFAAKGEGAYNVHGEVDRPIKTTHAANGTLRVLVSRSHRGQEEDIACLHGAAKNCGFKAIGSSLKFCLIAEGVADIYPRAGPTMEWDTAAAQCILEEAGGKITDLEGKVLKYNKPILLNPGFLAKGGG